MADGPSCPNQEECRWEGQKSPCHPHDCRWNKEYSWKTSTAAYPSSAKQPLGGGSVSIFNSKLKNKWSHLKKKSEVDTEAEQKWRTEAEARSSSEEPSSVQPSNSGKEHRKFLSTQWFILPNYEVSMNSECSSSPFTEYLRWFILIDSDSYFVCFFIYIDWYW